MTTLKVFIGSAITSMYDEGIGLWGSRRTRMLRFGKGTTRRGLIIIRPTI